MDETWRPVVGMEESHQVSDWGRVRSSDRLDNRGRRWHGRLLTNARMSGRYMRIRMRHQGSLLERSVHIMVLEAFVGPRPSGAHACHNDGDRWNNTLANLRWDTPSRNQLDKLDHGTMPLGVRNVASVLSERHAACIKALALEGVPAGPLSDAFGVSTHTVDTIRRGQTWEWLAPATDVPAGLAKALVAVARERLDARGGVARLRPGSKRASSHHLSHERLARAEQAYAEALAIATYWADTHQEEAPHP